MAGKPKRPFVGARKTAKDAVLKPGSDSVKVVPPHLKGGKK